ncbi:hypothetical protein M885DRAFT_558166 [Pelagophyceae sp. CCMP2097]|nr:hypothetical protein M885DRAFT_558166 [Pelagophyceae sp. CCMP2097]|eukprot:CAMPEP_0184103204 /NCGR_PEP_ID=MMETSP0974-20121125/13731_1 /TAXON_ID=483370 /ORGANISM="non described non described, Strain CCMP2097" /LENGTH=67 /DNA_ID=CAMNT_0026406163 /DNA_START=40 /DNA_END=243 /DNA_ORIENTATION=+
MAPSDDRKVGLGIVPARIQYIMDRFEITKKISRKQRHILDHHFLLQREFAFMEKAVLRAAKRANADE